MVGASVWADLYFTEAVDSKRGCSSLFAIRILTYRLARNRWFYGTGERLHRQDGGSRGGSPG